MIVFQESWRYCVSSELTFDVASGIEPGMISGDGVLTGPQRVDHRAHQAQDAAGALEALKRRPLLVERVEQLRVDRVGRA